MPLDLHQRLSEFSYGYGATREVERLLKSAGLRPTPFLPSLIHEAQIGADVVFDRPGVSLLMQFKLGEELQRFRRQAHTMTVPILDRPFWRFNVDTSASDGQYDLLLKAEQADQEVYYVAPRFASWRDYATAFQNEEVLERSLILPPSEIDTRLAEHGVPDGQHRIVYDTHRLYVCSDPIEAYEVELHGLAEKLHRHLKERAEPMDAALKRVFESFDRRREIREPDAESVDRADQRFRTVHELSAARPSPQQLAVDRRQRLDEFRGRAKTEGDAMFAAVGIETWASGTQLFAVTSDGSG